MIKQIFIEETSTILNYDKVENIRIIQGNTTFALVASTYTPVGYIRKQDAGFDVQIMNYVLYAGTLETCQQIQEFILQTGKETIRLPSDAIMEVDSAISV